MTNKRFTLQESDIYNRNDVIHDKGIEMPQSTVCDLLNEQEEEIQELKQTIDTIAKDYEESHGMDIRNAEWFTAW